MINTYVTFDTRSGHILGVHHGAVDAEQARGSMQTQRPHEAKISDEHTGVIPVNSEDVDEKKLYKVDVGRKALVAATAEDGGVGFGFGEVGGSSGAGMSTP